ncbi:hypothetical protein [Pseudogemmobacter humi]|uniref:Uncharacterized protein n=1 Tax=Pseudogemmobacter humi TaxID=2483812 RepID=A0A3P5WXF6_9RHOB|nr:hypothetical protein [Pseudogemmobacter humi]VDC20149.1 hypothetical protein XINFAN_00344 [Pseudogemmobacter humi]
MSDPAGDCLRLTDALLDHGPPALSPLGAGILAAHALGIAADSRSFARIFGIAHALVLRECVALAAEAGLIEPLRQDARSQRLHYRPSAPGEALLRAAQAAG